MNRIWKISSSNFKLDHSADDVSAKNSHDDSSVDDSFPDYGAVKHPVMLDVSDQLETPAEKKARKRSHLVAYTTMFVMSIGFSIVLSGVWPYMKSIDSSLEKAALGWVVAANPLGQMLASPILGLWGNKAGSIRGACIATVIFFIGGNVMYAMLYAFKDAGPDVAYYMMIVARFIVGVSSANVTLCRSYLAGSTTLKERTTGITIIAAAQALGFVVGPGIQAILTVVVKESSGSGAFVWDKYTSAGWVAAILGFINLIIVMPGIFQEFNIAEKERRLMNKSTADKNDPQMKLPKPDYIGICGILFAFFFVLFIYVLLETLAEPFVTDQYAVDDDYAMVAVGIALSAGGVISLLMFVVTTKLAKKYDERILLILMGMLPTVVGTFMYLPIAGDDIQIAWCNDTLPLEPNTNSSLAALELIDLQFDHGLFSDGDVKFLDAASLQNEVLNDVPKYDFFYSSLLREGDGGAESTGFNCTLGCPAVQTWCNDVPQLPLAQLMIAYIITVIGYPVVQALAQAIFSKMLGPKPQGLWMGILTGVGSLSRIAGPVFVSYIYTDYGTYWTFGVLAVGMLTSMLGLVALYKRIIPMKIPTRQKGYDNKIDEHDL